MEERQGVEVVEASGLDEAHDDFVISDAVVGAVAESDLAHNDVAAQQPLGPVVVCTDFWQVSVSDWCKRSYWGERGDLNPRPLGPQPSALTN